MPRIDRYVLRELAGAFAACIAVLLIVSLSGIVADVLNKITRGKVPAALLFSQLGLRGLDVLPRLSADALFLGVLLAYGRAYRDSEMAVAGRRGTRPYRRMARPLLWVALPTALVVGLTSLWLAPAALNTSKTMIDAANRRCGRGTRDRALRGDSVVRAWCIWPRWNPRQPLPAPVRAFRGGRAHRVVTAAAGELYQESRARSAISADRRFRVEANWGRMRFRIMRFKRNDIRVPDSEQSEAGRSEERSSSAALWGQRQRGGPRRMQWRIGMPIAALVRRCRAAAVAHTRRVPARYGRILVALLGYVVYLNFLSLVVHGRRRSIAGMARAVVVASADAGVAMWFAVRDERLPRPRRSAA